MARLTKLSRKQKFYTTIVEHFKKQYSTIEKMTAIYITKDNQVCGGEWLDAEGTIHIVDSTDIAYSLTITD